jgi:hypothetical protein
LLVAIAVPAVTKEKTLETDALAPNKFSSQSVIPSLSSSMSILSEMPSPSVSRGAITVIVTVLLFI